MSRRILLFLLVLVPMLGAAQLTYDGMALSGKSRRSYQDTVWTVSGWKTLDSKYRKWKFDFVLDGRQTLVSDTRVRLGGVRLGLEYRRVHRFGAGFYNLSDEIGLQSLAAVDSRITNARLSLGYASLFYERVMFFNRKWEWSLTAHLGAGRISGTYTLEGSETPYEYVQNVRPVEGSTTLYYHLTYFMSIGTGIGYRYMQSTPAEIRPLYNGPVAILRLRIKLIKMTMGFFRKEVRDTY